jgi:integrase
MYRRKIGDRALPAYVSGMLINTPAEIRKALGTKGYHHAGRGLYLAVAGQSHRWVFRYGRPLKEARIGDYSERTQPEPEKLPDGTQPRKNLFTLAEARLAADALRIAKKAGTDPQIATRPVPIIVPKTLRTEVMDYRARNAPTPSGGGWCQDYYVDWLAAMNKHILPTLGDRDPAGIKADEFAALLLPIWSRPLGRRTAIDLNAIYARMIGIDPERFPKGNPIPVVVDHILPNISDEDRARRKRSHGALAVAKASTLYALTAAAPITCRAAKALQLLLLTCAPRSAEIRELRWGEINIEKRQLELGYLRIKNRHDHIIPLSDVALGLIAALRAISTDTSEKAFVFTGRKGKYVRGTYVPYTGGMQEDAMRLWFQKAMPGEIEVQKGQQVVCDVHGLRSTYLTWIASWAPMEVYRAAEFGMDHVPIGTSKIGLEYDRYAYGEQRKLILDQWTPFLLGSNSRPKPIRVV